MKKYFKRFLASLGALIGRLFNIGIPLKVVLLLVLLVGGVAVGLTYSKMMKKVGGKADFDEAKHQLRVDSTVIRRDRPHQNGPVRRFGDGLGAWRQMELLHVSGRVPQL